MSTKIRRPQLLSPSEVAARCGMSVKTIRRWIDRGELHAHNFGRQIRVAEDDLAAFIALRRR